MGELLSQGAQLETALSPGTFDRLRQELKRLTGIDLAGHKTALVQSRLNRRVLEVAGGDFEHYLDLVDGDRDEEQRFISALTTNVTDFFRERHHFQMLKERLPALAAGRPVTVWSAACSTGEEPWSIAMTLADAPFGWRVLATDLDAEVVATARAGVYPYERVASLPDELKRRCFDHDSARTRARVKDWLRPSVSIGQLNLLHDWPIKGPFEAIFCRNVLIYFDTPTREAVVDRLARLLRPGGLLFLGHSESLLGSSARFDPVGHTTFVRRADP